MMSKVILFCALLFCSKFVASTPLNEESLRLRAAYPPNNWQGNQNNAEQYHGNGFARTHNANSMTNPVRQYANGHEYNANQGRQHFENYGFNSNPVSVQSLPLKDRQVNFAPGTNNQRLGVLPSKSDSYPVRTENRPIRIDNNHQYRQQNWPLHNRFINSAASAIASVATGPARPLMTVQEPYRSPTQHMQLNRPVNRQQYQTVSTYVVPQDVHYHPVTDQTGKVRYVAHSDSNTGHRARPVRYENYNEGHAHNHNVVKSGGVGYVQNSPSYSGPTNTQHFETHKEASVLKPDSLTNVGSYSTGPGSNSNNANTYSDTGIEPTHLGLNENTRYVENPIIPSGPDNSGPNTYSPVPIAPTDTVPDNTRHVGYSENIDSPGSKNQLPQNTNRYAESVMTDLGIDTQGLNTHSTPVVPAEAILDKTENRYVEGPTTNLESNNPSAGNTYNEGFVPTFDTILPSSTGEEKHYGGPLKSEDATVDTNNPEKYLVPAVGSSNPHHEGSTNPHQPVHHFSDGAELRDFVMKQVKKNFVLIHANGTIEYINRFNKPSQPNYTIMKKHDSPPASPLQPNPTIPADGQPLQGILDSFSNKNDDSLAPLLVIPTDNDYDQPSVPNNNGHNPSIGNNYNPSSEQQPSVNGYSQSPEQEPLTVNGYNPSPEQQPPTSFDYSPSPEQQPSAYDVYNPLQEQQPPTKNDFNPSLEQQPSSGNGYNPSSEQQPLIGRGFNPSSEQQPLIGRGFNPSSEQQPPTGIGYNPSPVQQPPTGSGYNPSPEQQPPTGNGYNPLPEQQPPTPNVHNPALEQQPSTASGYNPSPEQPPNGNSYDFPSGPQYPNYYPFNSKNGDNVAAPKLPANRNPDSFYNKTDNQSPDLLNPYIRHHKKYHPHGSRWGNNYPPPSKLHTHVSPGKNTSPTPILADEVIQTYPDSLVNKTSDMPPFEQPYPLDNKNNPDPHNLKSDDDYVPSPLKIHRPKYTPDDKEVKKYLDSISNNPDAIPSYNPVESDGSDYNTSPDSTHSDDSNKPYNSKRSDHHAIFPSKIHRHTHSAPASEDEEIKKKIHSISDKPDSSPTSNPLEPSASNYNPLPESIHSNDKYKPYNTKPGDLYAPSKIQRHTYPSSTLPPEDREIKKFLDSISDKPDNIASSKPVEPSGSNYNSLPETKKLPSTNEHYHHYNSKRGHHYPSSPSKIHKQRHPSSTPPPEEKEIKKIFDSISDKSDYSPSSNPLEPSGNDYNPLPESITSNEHYNHHNAKRGDHYPPSASNIHRRKHPSSTPAPEDKEITKILDSISDKSDNSPSSNPLEPSGSDYNPLPESIPSNEHYNHHNAKRGDHYPPSASKIHRHKHPSSTPAPEDKEITKILDSISDKSDNSPSSNPLEPSGSDYNPLSESIPSNEHSNHYSSKGGDHYPQSAPKIDRHENPSSTPAPEDKEIKKILGSISDKPDNSPSFNPLEPSSSDYNPLPESTPSNENYNPSNSKQDDHSAPSSSRKHKPISTTPVPDSKKSKTNTDSISSKPPSNPIDLGDNDSLPKSVSHKSKSGKHHKSSSSKMHRKKQPSSTSAPDDKEVKGISDSISNIPDSNSSPSPLEPSDSNYKPLPESVLSNDNKDNLLNKTKDNTYTTPSTRLHTVISPGIFRSTTENPEDVLIQNFIKSLASKKDSDDSPIPSENEQGAQNYNNTTSDDLNNPSNDGAISPVESTTEDEIITLSPIETATDNVTYDTTQNPIDTDSPDKQDADNNKTLSQYVTLSPNNKDILEIDDDVEEVVIQITKNNSTEDPVISLKEIGKKRPKSACNDTKPGENSTIATISTIQSGVNTSDTSTGDNILESNSPTNDIKITLSIPNDSDGTISITVQVPDSTGNEETSSDDKVVVTVKGDDNTDAATENKETAGIGVIDTDQKFDDAADLNKNMIIDLSTALVVMNKSTDKDFLNQMMSSNSTMNMFIFQMPPQDKALVEKSKEIIYYANGTVCEQITETTWKNKDDPTPRVVTTTKIYHKDDKLV